MSLVSSAWIPKLYLWSSKGHLSLLRAMYARLPFERPRPMKLTVTWPLAKIYDFKILQNMLKYFKINYLSYFESNLKIQYVR